MAVLLLLLLEHSDCLHEMARAAQLCVVVAACLAWPHQPAGPDAECPLMMCCATAMHNAPLPAQVDNTRQAIVTCLAQVQALISAEQAQVEAAGQPWVAPQVSPARM